MQHLPLQAEYEKKLVERIRNSDQDAFTLVFNHYFRDLVTFAFSLIRNKEQAEEMVQEVFFCIWENRQELSCYSSLKSYLLKSVQNRCLNWIRHLGVRNRYAEIILKSPLLAENDTEQYILHSELVERLQHILESLPPELAETFSLSKLENLTYDEIAAKQAVSVRTIESRIAKTLHIIRKELGEMILLLPLLAGFLN